MKSTQASTILDEASSPATATYEDRKSEFIAEACHVESAQEALAFVEAVRQRNPKARHVAYATIWGGGAGAGERMSDDGEPSGTAGKPIFDVLRAGGLTDCVVTVTRYFGGILLGSGGLVRAYSSAASSAIAAAHHAAIVEAVRLRLVVPYALRERMVRILADCGGRVADEQFTDVVTQDVDVPCDAVEPFEAQVREVTAAGVTPQRVGESRLVRGVGGE